MLRAEFLRPVFYLRANRRKPYRLHDCILREALGEVIRK